MKRREERREGRRARGGMSLRDQGQQQEEKVREVDMKNLQQQL
jgi:hypothetical protein